MDPRSALFETKSGFVCVKRGWIKEVVCCREIWQMLNSLPEHKNVKPRSARENYVYVVILTAIEAGWSVSSFQLATHRTLMHDESICL
jgi:hypothetical protein